MFRFPGRGSSGGNSGSGGKRGQKKKTTQKEPAEARAKTRSKEKNLDVAELPAKLKKLRACMICSLIKSDMEFEEDGCDNCESFLHLAGTRGSTNSYTSENFEGMIGMIAPDQSWVARWQHIVTLKPGLYAVNVRGEVDRWVKTEMEDAGLPYYCRDKTQLFKKKRDEDKPRKRRNRRASVESIGDENNEENDEIAEISEGVDAVTTDDVDNVQEENVDRNETEGDHNAPDSDERRPFVDDAISTVSSGMPYRSGRRFSTGSSSSD